MEDVHPCSPIVGKIRVKTDGPNDEESLSQKVSTVSSSTTGTDFHSFLALSPDLDCDRVTSL